VATTFAEARSAVCSTGGLMNKFPGVAREFITLLGAAATVDGKPIGSSRS